MNALYTIRVVWIAASLAAYLSLMMVVFARYSLRIDGSKIPRMLRTSCALGFIALGCLALDAAMGTVEIIFMTGRSSFWDTIVDGSTKIATRVSLLGPFALFNILHMGLCWCWMRRLHRACHDQDVFPEHGKYTD